MKTKICFSLACFSLLLAILTACSSDPIEANPLPTLVATPAVTPSLASVPLPTALALTTHEVQQPTVLASASVIPLASATIAPTSSILPTSTKPADSTPVALASPTAVVCKHEWFFSSSSSYCPFHEAISSYAVIQLFEHGQMIWIEETDIFYIMFHEGAYPNDSRQVYLILYGIEIRPGGSVDNRVGEPAPAGLYEPVSGFGLIWRNEVDGVDLSFVRSSLGWATKPENGFQTLEQCVETPTFSWQACYLLSPQNTIIETTWTSFVGHIWGEFTPNELK